MAMDETITRPLLAESKVYHEGCWDLGRCYLSQAYYGTLLKSLSKLSYASILLFLRLDINIVVSHDSHHLKPLTHLPVIRPCPPTTLPNAYTLV